MNPSAPIRIVHVTVYRDLPAGIRKQIKYEHEASSQLRGADWTCVALHNGRRTEAFERPIPAPFRPILLRSLYGWIVTLRLSRKHDFVLVRHMPFDPFAFLFAPLVRNRVSVHHSKEVEELPLIRPGWTGRAAAALERLAGRYAVRRTAGVLGVTTEIARYECDTRAPGKPYSSYPNGIDLRAVDVVEDRRVPDQVHAVFICETFSGWHGLDRLVDAVAAAPDLPPNLQFHLIGKLSPQQLAHIASLGDRQSCFRVHGFLDAVAYRAVLAQADIGLGSLAMDRQNMREGATLKVRELLAMGLPVYSGHRDTALPDGFPYYVQQSAVDLREVHALAMRMKGMPRGRVREASAPYIDKRTAMQHVADWLRDTFGGNPAGSHRGADKRLDDMCGIAGFLRADPSSDAPEHAAVQMVRELQHRGPDDEGVWADRAAGLALAHRRLSIVDLSAAGHQPMASASGRFVLAYNGEIYNHEELRRELTDRGVPPPWRGHSDTETLLACVEAWGLEPTLQRASGMFAIALWDRRDRVLWLARDRFGEKPLYFGWCGGSLAFASELKALRAHPGFSNAVCREALAEYLRFMYVPAPRTIYEGVFKLEPGCLLRVQHAAPAGKPSVPLRAPANYGTLSIRRWWSLADVVEQGARHPLTDPHEARQLLEQRLRHAVQQQSLADVPLGAFLSGGVDSSLITALMQQQSAKPVRTFTVGFEESGFDESPYARAVAQHLGTDHTEMLVTAQEARDVIPLLPRMYDEPFADSSQLPTHLVCRAARRHVTVALSGDAGDELFGGYNRYFWAPRIWSRVRPLPHPLRQGIARGLTAISPERWNRTGNTLNRLMRGTAGIARLGEKAHKLGSRLRDARTLDDFYLQLVSEWQNPERLVLGLLSGEAAAPTLMTDALPVTGMDDPRARMMYRDSMTYLPDDILCKVDRAAMATSLETRVPFLDKDVAEAAWRLPVSMKIRGGEGKSVLRDILYDYVPRELIERPKSGFGIPVGEWLRGPLRGWADDLLGSERLRRQGYLDPVEIRTTWTQHLSGGHDWTARLWSVLMFQSWLEANA